jgi:hypothetical protein
MKRSAFRPKWTPPERQPLVVPDQPPEVRGVITASAQTAVVVPKDEPLRSEPYRKWVASLACFSCGLKGHSQAAHSNSPIHGKGKGLKADDRYLFPLCCAMPGRMGCHERHDLGVDMTREERRAAEERYVERMHLIAAAHGWDLETLRRKG